MDLFCVIAYYIIYLLCSVFNCIYRNSNVKLNAMVFSESYTI